MKKLMNTVAARIKLNLSHQQKILRLYGMITFAAFEWVTFFETKISHNVAD